jgi:hypothetical protein
MAFFITKIYGVDLPAEIYRLAANSQITILTFLSKPHRGSTQSAPRFREGWCWETPSTGRLTSSLRWWDCAWRAGGVALAGLSANGITAQLLPQGRRVRRHQPPFTSPSFLFTPIRLILRSSLLAPERLPIPLR